MVTSILNQREVLFPRLADQPATRYEALVSQYTNRLKLQTVFIYPEIAKHGDIPHTPFIILERKGGERFTKRLGTLAEACKTYSEIGVAIFRPDRKARSWIDDYV